ncbi:RNA-binding protein [Algihabitans albus]|uniref:RNA-binding protein n=1 Tax=Algihabitans albus TaxID=2164067 RepID=UPI000E5CA7D2|nr:RNA-binding protein [Algihabitans albus]
MQVTTPPQQDERSEIRRGDGAPGRKTAGPQRRCLVTRASRLKGGLLRFVVSPEGMLVPDLSEKLPGRGLYVTPDRALLETAIAKKLFAKAARQTVEVPEDLPARVDELLRRRALDLIGFAKRAGQAVAGFDRVKSWIEQGRAALVVQAADGSEGSRQRLAGIAAAVGETLPESAGHHPKLVEMFGQAELGAAFGRTTAVHVAIAPGGLAKQLTSTTEQILSYETAAAAQKAAASERKTR